MSELNFNKTLHEVVCLNSLSFHKMRYRTFGDKKSPVILMVHGLTRTGQDFNTLANSLSEKYFVVCPDIVGRGDSDWLPKGVPYGYSQYLSDLNALINQIWGITSRTQPEDRKLIWVGTSMGGLLGMILASLSNTPITKLILNDIGPYLTNASLIKMQNTLSSAPIFKSLDDTLPYLQKVYAGFGDLTDDEWRATAKYMFKKNQNGEYSVHYDPRILDFNIPTQPPQQNEQQKFYQDGVIFWPYWMMIECHLYVIRGSESAILPQDLLSQMEQTKPAMKTHTVPRAAHAPALQDQESLSIITAWIEENTSKD